MMLAWIHGKTQVSSLIAIFQFSDNGRRWNGLKGLSDVSVRLLQHFPAGACHLACDSKSNSYLPHIPLLPPSSCSYKGREFHYQHSHLSHQKPTLQKSGKARMSALRTSFSRLTAIPRWSAPVSRARLSPTVSQARTRSYAAGPARDVMTGEIIQLPDIDVGNIRYDCYEAKS